MPSFYFVLTFLKYLCPLEQNIKGNNQLIGAQNKYMDALKKDIVDCKQRWIGWIGWNILYLLLLRAKPQREVQNKYMGTLKKRYRQLKTKMNRIENRSWAGRSNCSTPLKRMRYSLVSECWRPNVFWGHKQPMYNRYSLHCAKRAPLLLLRSWVALSFKACESVRHRWHPTSQPNHKGPIQTQCHHELSSTAL